MALLDRLSSYNPTQLRLSKPSSGLLDKVLRRIERQAEGLDEKLLAPPREVIEEVTVALRKNITEIPRKSLKLVAAGGLQYLSEQPDGQSLLERFFQIVVSSGSALLMKSLLLGYLRIASSNSALCDSLRNILIRKIDLLPERWIKRVDAFGLLDIPIGMKLGKEILFSKDKSPIEVLEQAGLKRGLMLGGGFSKEAFLSMCHLLSIGHKEEVLERFLSLLEEMNTLDEPIYPFAHPQSGDIASVCSALLSPYRTENPTDIVKGRIENFLLERFGDPRANRLRWSKVGEEEVGVLSRWLTKESFELLMQVLSSTNNTGQWKDRAKFWGHYIDHEFVSEVWVVFGPDAYRQANRLVKEGEIKSRSAFGVLERENIQLIHSAILMKIGDLIVSEWTHDGKIRIYSSSNPRKPKFYSTRYSPNSIRDDSSPDFVKVHLGAWEYDVETYIYRATNIPGPSRRGRVRQESAPRILQSTCSRCGQEVPPRWLDARGVCLSCGGGDVRNR